jgi:hypothetical protein
MNLSRTLFGMSPPHIQPLTPVSEVSEPPESPSPYPYLDGILETREQVKSNPRIFILSFHVLSVLMTSISVLQIQLHRLALTGDEELDFCSS